MIGERERDLRRYINDINDEDWNSRDTISALDDYAYEVDSLSHETIERTALLKNSIRDGEEFLSTMHTILQFIPLHIIIDDQTTLKADRWLGEHATGNYEFVEFKNAAIIIFNDPNDHMLFRINFGV